MKKLFLFTFYCLLIFNLSTVFAADNDFRKTKWGMTKNQVKAIEKKGKLEQETDNAIVYTDTVLDQSIFVVYFFINNTLSHARYKTTEQHTNKAIHLVSFNNFKNALTQKYGVPFSNKTIWINDLYKDDPKKYGYAISKGQLMYGAEWKTKSTDIQLVLAGDNYKIYLEINYKGIKYNNLREQENKKKIMEQI